MLASKLLNAIARILDSAALVGPEAHLEKLVDALQTVQSELHTELDAIDNAADDVELLHAMQRWNSRAAWAELLVSALSDALEQPIPT